MNHLCGFLTITLVAGLGAVEPADLVQQAWSAYLKLTRVRLVYATNRRWTPSSQAAAWFHLEERYVCDGKRLALQVQPMPDTANAWPTLAWSFTASASRTEVLEARPPQEGWLRVRWLPAQGGGDIGLHDEPQPHAVHRPFLAFAVPEDMRPILVGPVSLARRLREPGFAPTIRGWTLASTTATDSVVERVYGRSAIGRDGTIIEAAPDNPGLFRRMVTLRRSQAGVVQIIRDERRAQDPRVETHVTEFTYAQVAQTLVLAHSTSHIEPEHVLVSETVLQNEPDPERVTEAEMTIDPLQAKRVYDETTRMEVSR